MLWMLEEAGRSAGSWVLFTLLWTMLYKALHTSTSWLELLARIKTRQRGSLFSKGLVRNPFLKVWPMLLNSVFKTCLCFSLPFFSIFHLRWEREAWRPPRPPLHLGQRTHMITWLWTWTRSCQTLFGPPGQNQVWQETCWKVRDDSFLAKSKYLYVLFWSAAPSYAMSREEEISGTENKENRRRAERRGACVGEQACWFRGQCDSFTRALPRESFVPIHWNSLRSTVLLALV